MAEVAPVPAPVPEIAENPPQIEQPNDPDIQPPAAAATAPQAVAPPWFEAAMQQFGADIREGLRTTIKADILPDLMRLKNQTRGDGVAIPYEIVPFPNGQDPTRPPHNLPALTSENAVYGLRAAELNAYLTGYAVPHVAPAANPHATNQRKKAALLQIIKD